VVPLGAHVAEALRMATRRTISGEIELLAGDPVVAERENRALF